ncbi:MAG: kelch repeat-containing protein [Bacteroidia bacterium]|jgi:N-acetylneuraminic acid mutarotase|uniref:Kelch repeat-containing protein n=1 Tax=Candidatus Pollutiaquabacter sp. TaxID=3416354 RepID=UPI0039365BC9|nr:hypothetical protein [Bacteroidota bacterium]
MKNHTAICTKLFLALLLVVNVPFAKASYRWSVKNDFPGGIRNAAVGFSIGNTGYLCTGYDGTWTVTDCWSYDFQNDTWTQIADLPGVSRFAAAAFSVNQQGFVGFGWANPSGGQLADFWRYNPVTNSWTALANFPGASRYTVVTLVLNGKAYCGTGYLPYTNDWWVYDPVTDTWTQKANFPGSARQSASGFALNGIGYLGLGYDGGCNVDFFAYDPNVNNWNQVADFPGPARYGAAAFTQNGLGYVGTGGDGVDFFSDFFSYDPVSDQWSPIDSLPGPGCRHPATFSLSNKAYVATGIVQGADGSDAVYEYGPFDPSGIEDIKSPVASWQIVQNANLQLSLSIPATSQLPSQIELFSTEGKLIYSTKDCSSFNFAPHPQTIYLYRLTHPDGYEKAGKLVTR